ncbi:MAG TPA: Gfo/Idh/MocA family oxidoreductase [Anaerolineae bacterium]
MRNGRYTQTPNRPGGLWFWAERVHIPSIALSESAELSAICGPDAERARRMAERYHALLGTNDLQQLVTCPHVDAILVAAPNDAHAAAAIAAARAGKPVLCEKPLARTLDEAQLMCSEVEHTDVQNMVAFTWRNVPAAILTQKMVTSGEIGRVLHVGAHFLHHGWLALDTRRPWRFDRSRMGSGILGDLGVHLFDMLAWMLGEPITRVCARLSTFGPKPDIGGQPPIFDDGHLMVDFAGGAHGSLRISRVATSAYQPPFRDMHQGAEIYGETGALIFDLHHHSQLELRRVNQPAVMLDAPKPLPNSTDEWTVTREIGRRQIEHFAQAVRSGHPVNPSFKDGLRAQAVMQAAEWSQETEGWVDVELTA